VEITFTIAPEAMRVFRDQIEAFKEEMERAVIAAARVPAEQMEVRRYQAYDLRIEYGAGNGLAAAIESIAGSWSFGNVPISNRCPCPLCQAERSPDGGEFVYGEVLPAMIATTPPAPPDDQTAYTSLQELLADTTPYEVIQARDALRRGEMHGRSSYLRIA
jgi:hypothetical protein